MVIYACVLPRRNQAALIIYKLLKIKNNQLEFNVEWMEEKALGQLKNMNPL